MYDFEVIIVKVPTFLFECVEETYSNMVPSCAILAVG